MATAARAEEVGAAADSAAPVVSVIVPVRDRDAQLRELLAALARQTVSPDQFEIVIGDDGSRDDSTEGLATADGRIRVLLGPPRNSYAARNRAAGAARGAVLAFCDSDCRPARTWLEEGLRALESADAAAGSIRFDVPAKRSVWTLIDIEETKDHERQVRAGNAETANLFVRRELYERLGGFDELIPEAGDFDFASRCVQAGARLVYAPKAFVWHPARDRARPLLHMLWIMNRWYAARVTRAGERPVALKLRCWIPCISVARARRRAGLPLGLDRRRLAENGIEPSLGETLCALPIMYLLVPYLRCLAQLRGWWEGRRLR